MSSSWASAVNLRVKVHPVVLFQIADAYERRSMENHRVIGTLVGESISGIENLQQHELNKKFVSSNKWNG